MDANKPAKAVRKAVKATVESAAARALAKLAELNPPPVPGAPGPETAVPQGTHQAAGAAAPEAGPGGPRSAYRRRAPRPTYLPLTCRRRAAS